jgi:hypothetical protein
MKFSPPHLARMLAAYQRYSRCVEQLNASLHGRKIRRPPFPSEVSENIVGYCIGADWQCSKGDLIMRNGSKVEVKGFSSSSAIAHIGPNQTWDLLYFVDCTRHQELLFRVWGIPYPSHHPLIESLLVGRTTIAELRQQKKKITVRFSTLKTQLGPHCHLIYSGHLVYLLRNPRSHHQPRSCSLQAAPLLIDSSKRPLQRSLEPTQYISSP